MRIYILLFITSLFYPCLVSAVSAEWTCTELASRKDGPVILTCGVGTAPEESLAREKALLNAKKEFRSLCKDSADCRGYEVNIEPLRNSCEKLGEDKYKCYRGMRYTIISTRQNRVTDDTIEDKERLLREKLEEFEAAKREHELEIRIQEVNRNLENKNYGHTTNEERFIFSFKKGDKDSSYMVDATLETNRYKLFGPVFSISYVQYPTTVGEVDSAPSDPFFIGKQNERIDYESLGVNVGPKISFGQYENNLTLFAKLGLNFYLIEMEDPNNEEQFYKLDQGVSVSYSYGAYLVFSHIGVIAEIYEVNKDYIDRTAFVGVVLSF